MSAESVVARGVRRPAAAPRTPPAPVASGFAAAIGEARRLRTDAAWLAVANRPEVRDGPRMRSLAESLQVLGARRANLPTGPQRDRQLADLTQRISRAGYTILAIAENRRLELGPSAAPVPARPTPVEPAGPPEVIDSAGPAATLREARDSVVTARRAHDSLGVLVRALDASLASTERPGLASASPAIALGILLVLGLALRFGTALVREVRDPAIAHAREAESVGGAPVLATVRDAQLDGPARFRPSGVDPFRMLYLGLTATGTRTRTALITGSDPVIAAAVGARLAIAAAADHRTTIVVDLDPVQIVLARMLRERAEPGLTDALAGAFRWREVARPIGSSDGLPITLLPAGTERDDFAVGEELDRLCEDFARFRAGFELTILVAPPAAIELAVRLVGPSPLLVATSGGDTSISRFAAECAELRGAGRRIHGLVLWDTDRPVLPSRAELAALLSKRKGRTPGGSFEAVRRAIHGDGPSA